MKMSVVITLPFIITIRELQTHTLFNNMSTLVWYISSSKKLYPVIGLITVFDAILTGRQSGQKLQCLYGSPMANNIFQN